MNFKRIGRILVCLLLVCCLIVNISPIRAKATGVAAGIVAASSVFVPPAWAVYATLAAIGIYAGVESGAFEQIGQDCITALEATGTWIQDGAVELLRTVDSLGQASYYVDSGLMEDVRSWAYVDVIPQVTAFTDFSFDLGSFGSYHITSNIPVGKVVVAYQYDSGNITYGSFLVSSSSFVVYQSINSKAAERIACSSNNGVYYHIILTSPYLEQHAWQNIIGTVPVGSSDPKTYGYFNGVTIPDFTTSLDVSLGSLPAQSSNLTDGTSARAWSEDYTDRGLKVYGGGSGNDNNDGKWFWKLMLPLTAAELFALSQADEWSAETPAEFAEYTTNAEYEILSEPEVEFGTGLEISPASGGESGDDTGDDSEESTEPTTDAGGVPDTGGDTDTGTDTDSGADTETGVVVLPTWLKEGISNIWNGLLDILSTLLGLPASIASAIWEAFPPWLQEGIHNLVNGLSSILESLAAMPQIIIDGIAGVLTDALTWAFAVSDTFISTKVEALTAKYPYLDTFLALGTDLKSFLTGLGTTPPIIYINLGATNGSYDIGGQEVFMDLSWYAAYKPTMDTVLGGFIWLWLAWRIYLSIPGIISGASGVWGAASRSSERSMRSKSKEEST